MGHTYGVTRIKNILQRSDILSRLSNFQRRVEAEYDNRMILWKWGGIRCQRILEYCFKIEKFMNNNYY